MVMVWQFFIYLFVAHLVCLITVLNGSFKSCILCLFRFIWSVLLPYLMDLSVTSTHCSLFVCSFIFGWLNCHAECNPCSDGQLLTILVHWLPWFFHDNIIIWIVSTLATKGFPGLGFPSNKGFP